MDESPITDTPSESKLPLILAGLALIGVIIFGVYSIQLKSRLDKLATQGDQTSRVSPIQVQETVKVVEQLNVSLQRQTTELNDLNNSVSTIKKNFEAYKKKNEEHNHVIASSLKKLADRSGGSAIRNHNNTGGGTPIPSGGIKHQIVSGDTLSRLASKYRTPMAAILDANPGLTINTSLRPGKTIVIPGSQSGTDTRQGSTQSGTNTSNTNAAGRNIPGGTAVPR